MSVSQSLDRPGSRKRHSHASSRGERVIMQHVPVLLLVLLSFVLMVMGAYMLLAGIASYQAEAFISSWDKQGREPSVVAWEIAHNAAQRAIRLYPVADGDRLDRLGRIYSWKQFRQPYAAPAAQHSRRAALETYRAAIAARPSWPYTWARLAHSKLYLQEFDSEFDQAMAQAFRLGPWRIGVNLELAEIGFDAWPQLNEAQRQATRESTRRSAAFGNAEAQHLLEIAQRTGRIRVLCESLSHELISMRKLAPCVH
ncbi:hypothetical protein [Metapseudomonas boanensis]|uniref:Uncharacterized protein n=1 Tax=Metapseudomonas boanensis TaxID=2822138 RepID=A0ABS5XFF1_9GAMM|nr:hypothetical protein [Pseudomonas boanensis]MBT8765800.1 hypothetical protein [Pseudomonas boanensis]